MQPQSHDLVLLDRVHKGVDIKTHAQILFGGLQLEMGPFYPLCIDCLNATRTGAAAWKVFRRVQRAFHLARYVEHVAPLGGAMAECGVFQGFSALLTCRVRQGRDPAFRGRDQFLLDSFEGLSAPVTEDMLEYSGEGGGVTRRPSHAKGHFAVGMDSVRERFGDFPEVGFIKGWLPGTLSQLPERKWSFVHIDVDLYEPTLGCLEYFYPRMMPGGVILNDDFSSPLFPGGGRAWIEFFDRVGGSYAVLDTGQSVFMKPSFAERAV